MSINYDPKSRKRLSIRVAVEFTQPSKTVQSAAAATDINNIVERYQRTGSLPPARTAPQWADVTGLQGDLTDRVENARDTIAQVEADLSAHRKKVALDKQAQVSKGTPPTPPTPPPIEVPVTS